MPSHVAHKHTSESLMHRNSLHEHSRSLSGPNGMNILNSPGKMPYMSGKFISVYNTHTHRHKNYHLFCCWVGVDPRLSNPHDNRPNIAHRAANQVLDSTQPRKQHSHSVETKTDYGRYRLLIQ